MKTGMDAVRTEVSRPLRGWTPQVRSPHVVIDRRQGESRLKGLIKLVRLHQWSKNLLLIVPLATSHLSTDLALSGRLLLGFVAFGLIASSGYILNDVLDCQSDRKHPTKRRRPLASGLVPVPIALVLMIAMLAAGAAMTFPLPGEFRSNLFLYLVLSVTYSCYLKRKKIIDVVCLAWLYTHRIIAGGALIATGVSPWLLAFSMFFFLCLALAKRYTELSLMQGASEPIPGRGYLPEDLDLIRSIGPSSGHLCILVFCLYINSQDVLKLYHRPERLWFICPILFYWIMRVWFLAHRRELKDDPVVFALNDRVSYLAGALIVVLLIAAT